MKRYKYPTDDFDLSDDEELWEKFMCFMRGMIPYDKEKLDALTEIQRNAAISFIYESEVWGDGHISFLDLYGGVISAEDVIKAFGALRVSEEYSDILREMPKRLPEGFGETMESLDAAGKLFEPFDRRFYELGGDHVEDKITAYIGRHHTEFFEYDR